MICCIHAVAVRAMEPPIPLFEADPMGSILDPHVFVLLLLLLWGGGVVEHYQYYIRGLHASDL